jgi:hypothetical protein
LGVQANFLLLQQVLASDAFAPHRANFLRFVTGSPTLLGSAASGDEAAAIVVYFDARRSPTSLPTAHTCFHALHLSSEAYASAEALRTLLEVCAANSSAFGLQ